MSEFRDIVEFTSSKFAPVLPEDCQVNPGRYGAELAYWLCTELARRGVITSYPNYEDWGWYLEYLQPDAGEFTLLCGNVDGHNDRWLLSLRRHGRKAFGRDKPPFENAAPVLTSLRAVLEAEPTVADLAWLWDNPGNEG